jgi:hypothetical protein
MKPTLDTQVRQSARTASRVVEGKAVVVVMDTHALHTLNAVGTYVWENADGRSIGAIVDGMIDAFEVDRERATQDVLAFVEKLAALQALELEEPA